MAAPQAHATPPTDPAFRGVSNKSPSFLIWRVENMQLAALPKEQYGVLHNGDSYLIYSAFEVGQPCGVQLKSKSESKGPMEKHIHFWLGSETSQDEAGVAAYKAVELDDILGGSPVQHREVEGSESPKFLSYFKDGLRICKGGIASGFRKVDDVFVPVLYSVKGKRTPIIRQLPEVDWKYFNDGDVFVLDARDGIFVWTGKKANNYEKIQGAKLAQKLKEEHGMGTIIIVEDGQEQLLGETERKYLGNLLPFKQKMVASAEEAPADEAIEKAVLTEIKLYRCSDEGGTLKVTEVKKGPLLQSDLDSNDSFIIDNCANGVWVWVGKRASPLERTEAMRNAQGYVKKKEYSASTRVTRVIDGGEPTEFKTLFKGWREKDQTTGLGKTNTVGKVAHTVQTKFDASTLHSQRHMAAQSQMIDDGSGNKTVYRVVDFELVPVPEKELGRFYSGDCYVVDYKYEVNGVEHNMIYYWLGAHSGQDEQGTAALKTVELDDAVGGKAVQVRVTQNKEPPHFLAIFGGKMAILSGGKASAFDGDDAKDVGAGSTLFLQVRGNAAHNTKAVQVPLKAGSLNSNDVFVLLSPAATYVWCGKGSTGDEREMGKHVAAYGKAEPVNVFEGQEKADFWEAVGGKEPYASEKRLAEEECTHPARLFQSSNASGNFKVEEIVDFNQADLVEDDVMILDTWDAIYVWIGALSLKQEQLKAEETAGEYLRSDPAGRSADTPIMRVKQGHEPPTFTGFFGIWDATLWENQVSFDDMKKQMQEDNPGLSIVATHIANGHQEYAIYSLEILKEKDPEKLPSDVDPTQKQLHLSSEEFEKVFQMKRAEFDALPVWKQQNMKKSAGLF